MLCILCIVPKDSKKVLTVKNEDNIAEALLNWILHEKCNRIEYLERLQKLVKWSLVTPECIEKFNFPGIKGRCKLILYNKYNAVCHRRI